MRRDTIIRNEGEPWETKWFCLFLNRVEAKIAFLSPEQACRGHTRNRNRLAIEGSNNTWNWGSQESYSYLKQDLNTWLRQTVGPPEGEVWECDRYFYENEELLTIPYGTFPDGGRTAFKKQFKCWPDEYGTMHDYARWYSYKYNNIYDRDTRVIMGFRDKGVSEEFFTRLTVLRLMES